MNKHIQKKTKRNFPEFPPQEPKFIEQIHNKNETISETELKKKIKKIVQNIFLLK